MLRGCGERRDQPAVADRSLAHISRVDGILEELDAAVRILCFALFGGGGGGGGGRTLEQLASANPLDFVVSKRFAIPCANGRRLRWKFLVAVPAATCRAY